MATPFREGLSPYCFLCDKRMSFQNDGGATNGVILCGQCRVEDLDPLLRSYVRHPTVQGEPYTAAFIHQRMAHRMITLALVFGRMSERQDREMNGYQAEQWIKLFRKMDEMLWHLKQLA